MERFLMNLDPTRGQTLRDWLRSVSQDASSGRSSIPEMDGWPLAEQIGDHLAVVMEGGRGCKRPGAIFARRKKQRLRCRRDFVEPLGGQRHETPNLIFVPEKRLWPRRSQR